MLVVRSTPRTAARAKQALFVRFNHTDDGVFLRDTVRKLDYDNYACGLLFPQETRTSFFAIRAMNAEVASIKDTIRTNSATGKIRMQWWRDRIHDLYKPSSLGGDGGDARPEQETLVLRALAHSVEQHQLTRRWFERIIDARDEDLITDQPQTLRDLEVYADRTAASLLYLSLECLGVRDAVADRAAGHAGVAIGLTTLLRGTPYHLSREQLYLPEELLDKHGITTNDLLAAKEDPTEGKKLAPVVFEVACRAMDHLREARALSHEIPSGARPALRTIVPTALFLDQLEKANFNVFDPSLHAPNPVGLHAELLKSYLFRKY